MTNRGAPALRFDEVPISAPAVEPITVADVKAHRRLDADDTGQDALIALLITSAREYLEAYTGRKLITQTWRATMDAFPGGIVPPTPFSGLATWLPTPAPGPEIMLPYGPVQAVTSIQYLDATGALVTHSPAAYALDPSGPRARIVPSYGNSWPAVLYQTAAVQIQMRMGYGDNATDVPAGLRHWLLMRVGTLYENREEVAILGRGKVEALPFIDGLLDPYRLPVV